MRQYLVKSIATAIGSAAVAAAAWSTTIGSDPGVEPTAVVQSETPIITADRIFLTKAQSMEAHRSLGTGPEVKSILNIGKPMKYGDFVWNDNNVGAGETWIRVDLRSQIISMFRGPNEIGTAVMLYGAEGKETPTGIFPIRWKRKNHRSANYDGAPMPYSLRLTDDGVAIHGSDVRWGAATHGCIGVPLEFAERLFENAEPGDKVVIMRTFAGEQGPAST